MTDSDRERVEKASRVCKRLIDSITNIIVEVAKENESDLDPFLTTDLKDMFPLAAKPAILDILLLMLLKELVGNLLRDYLLELGIHIPDDSQTVEPLET
jgi:hypothetical protein